MEPLASAADLGRFLQRTIDEEAAALALASASGLVREYCGWSISAETTTFILDGTGTTLLSLPTLELTAVQQVRAAGVLLAEATSWPPADAEYSWSRNGQLRRGAGWPAGFRTVEADVTHGLDPVPDAVRSVVLSVAAVAVYNPGAALASKTVGAVTHVYRDPGDSPGLALPPAYALQLTAYRLP